MLVDGENLLGRLRRLLPPARRPRPTTVGGVMYRTLGRYFGGSITVAVLMGLYVLALGLVLGIPLAPLAALWAMLTDLIPQVGGFLGGSFLVLLASTQGVTTALIAGVAFVLYMNLENHLIQPAIVGPVGRPDAADDDDRRVRRRRRRSASPAPSSRRRSSARPRRSTWRPGAGQARAGRERGAARRACDGLPTAQGLSAAVATLRHPVAQIAQSVEQRTRNA